MFGNACDGGNVGSLRVVGKIFKFHCSDQFLAQFCHVIPPWFKVKKILGGILHDQSNKDKSMRLVGKLGRLERVEAGQDRKLPRSGFVHLLLKRNKMIIDL
jgi:hypothetical protein